MLNLKFHISEFCIEDDDVPQHIANKILNMIKILQPIREELGVPIIISGNSGYRPFEYEKRHGRSGKSQHCFKGKGAVDLTCNHDKLKQLLFLLWKSEFTRVCYYPNKHFIHCDFASKGKQSFICESGNNWKVTKFDF